MARGFRFLLAMALISGQRTSFGLNWDEWWTYDGVSGPEFWAAYNPDWRLCSLGRHQSPVNIEPDTLVYSRRLPMLKVQDQATEVIVLNTGHSIVLKFPTGTSTTSKPSSSSSNNAREAAAAASSTRFHASSQRVSLSLINRPYTHNGQAASTKSLHQNKISTSSYLPPHLYDNTPTSSGSSVEAEHFVVHEIHLHWGSKDRQGSEHRMGGRSFAGEAQVFAFNQRMYDNFTHAQAFAHGILSVSVFIQLAAHVASSPGVARSSAAQSTASNKQQNSAASANQQLDALGRLLPRLRFKSETATMPKFYLYDFLPHDLSEYIMYDGSLTQPSCAESVTWLILNRPIYINADVLDELRRTRQGSPQRPGSILEDNFRSPQPIGRRILLTNIDLRYSGSTTNVPGDENEIPFFMDNESELRRTHPSASEMCPSMSSSVYGNKHYVVNDIIAPSGL